MYTFQRRPIGKCREPQSLGLDERLRMLGSGSKPRIVYLYERPDNSTCRYRVANMCEAWRKAGHVDASYFFNWEFDELRDLRLSGATFVLCRYRYSPRLHSFLSQKKLEGSKFYFDIDDYVFDPKMVPLVINTIGHSIHNDDTLNYWYSYVSRINQAIRLCDGAITTNEFLRNRLEELFDIRCFVVPNFLNSDQLLISDDVYGQKAQNEFRRDHHFHVGYFSGTPTHSNDFAIVEGALDHLLGKYDHLRVHVVGYLASGVLSKHKSQVDFKPLMDHGNLQIEIGSCELNLVPLQTNVFTACKSQLKYFEAAVVGTTTIASPVGEYRNCVEHEKRGFQAFAHEWEYFIERSILAPDALRPIAEAARSHALQAFTPAAQAEAMRAAFCLDG